MHKELPVHTVFLSLGTNLGDRNLYLDTAIGQIALRLGRIIAQSSIHETPPWGFESTQQFLNMVVRIETRLLPRQLLFITQAIEQEMGRKEKSQGTYKDRVIDIDILFYDELELHTTELILPHPRYLEREFVLAPLSEVL